MSKLDGFFKNKVERVSIQPRPEAWSRLEANLSKKNKGLIWFKVAAAFLLMGLFITSIIWLQKGEVTQQIAEQSRKAGQEKATAGSKLKEQDIVASKSVEKKKTTPKLKLDFKKQKPNEPQDVTQNKPETDIENANAPTTVLETIPTETVAVATVVEKPIVIEYTLESVNYLKKETPAMAESADKKNSLQKAIDFAREAKNSDSPLGGLRQAKDDLFALNFKKDKQKKQ